MRKKQNTVCRVEGEKSEKICVKLEDKIILQIIPGILPNLCGTGSLDQI